MFLLFQYNLGIPESEITGFLSSLDTSTGLEFLPYTYILKEFSKGYLTENNTWEVLFN